MRSRDARIKGTWVLVEKETQVEHNTTTDVSNTCNGIATDEETQSETTTTVSNEQLYVVTNSVMYSKMKSYDYDYNTSAYSLETNESETRVTTESYGTYSLTVTINDDNTYLAEYVETLIKEKSEHTTIHNGGNPEVNVILNEYDYPLKKEETESGVWKWVDSDDSKIMIESGPLAGKLVRLSNDELIISNDHSSTEQDDAVVDFTAYTYNNINNPYEEKDGTKTTITTSAWDITSKTVWKKED